MKKPLKKQPSQKRALERVDKILLSCSALLQEEGLQGLTMPRLAKAAGVSVGSLYQYFNNKQAVLHALYENYLQALRDLVENFLVNIDQYESWHDGLGFILLELLKAEQESGPMQELNQAMQLYPELEELDKRHSNDVSELLIRVLKHYKFPGSKAQLQQLVYFSYAINMGTWSYRARYNSPKQLQQCNHWELRANIAVLEDYLEGFEK